MLLEEQYAYRIADAINSQGNLNKRFPLKLEKKE